MRAREASGGRSENQESLADLFASFLVESGAAFNAWADAAHRTGPQEHDVYKCAGTLIYADQGCKDRAAWWAPGALSGLIWVFLPCPFPAA